MAGGVLGVFCSHAYPHTLEDASILLPRGLKGADLMLYSVLHSLGVEVDVLPVMIGHGFRNIKRDYWWDCDEWADSEFHSDDDTGIDHNKNSEKKGKKNKKTQKIDDNDSYAYVDPGLKTHIGRSLNPFVAADSYEDQPFVEVSTSCSTIFQYYQQDPKLILCDRS